MQDTERYNYFSLLYLTLFLIAYFWYIVQFSLHLSSLLLWAKNGMALRQTSRQKAIDGLSFTFVTMSHFGCSFPLSRTSHPLFIINNMNLIPLFWIYRIRLHNACLPRVYACAWRQVQSDRCQNLIIYIIFSLSISHICSKLSRPIVTLI